MTSPNNLLAGEAMTDEKINRLIGNLREYGGRNTIHPHSGAWMIDAADALELLSASKPAAPKTLSDGAQFFACYLIDNCENEVIRDESIQAWLGKMLAIPRYHPAAPAQSGEPVAWPYEITRGHIECLINDHQRDGQKQLKHGLNSSGSYLIRVAESFRWCLDQIDAAPQSSQPVEAGEGETS